MHSIIAISMTQNNWISKPQVVVLLTVPPTVGSGVWRKLIRLPESPPSTYIKKKVNEPYARHTWGPKVKSVQQLRARWKIPECCKFKKTCLRSKFWSMKIYHKKKLILCHSTLRKQAQLLWLKCILNKTKFLCTRPIITHHFMSWKEMVNN